MNSVEAFETWYNNACYDSSDELYKLRMLEVWNAAVEHERETYTLKEVQRNRVFVEMARRLHEKQQETHLQHLQAMLESIGFATRADYSGDLDAVEVTAQTSNPEKSKVHGYQGFVARFEFNKDGSLNNVGIYE